MYFVHLALTIYWVILIARWIMDLVLAFNRGFRPSGVVALLFEFVFTVTDPPLKFLRRFIPPLRVGNVALDLSFLVLIFGVQIVNNALP